MFYFYCLIKIKIQTQPKGWIWIFGPSNRVRVSCGHLCVKHRSTDRGGSRDLEPAASCRLLRLRLAYLRMIDHRVATVPNHPLFAKNSTPYCFINAKTLTGQETTSLNTIIQKKNPNETNVSLGFLVRVTGLAVCFAYYSLVDQMTSIWCPTTRSN